MKCKRCGIDITDIETFEVFDKEGNIVLVDEDCYRELQDKGKDGVPSIL